MLVSIPGEQVGVLLQKAVEDHVLDTRQRRRAICVGHHTHRHEKVDVLGRLVLLEQIHKVVHHIGADLIQQLAFVFEDFLDSWSDQYSLSELGAKDGEKALLHD